MVRAAGPNRLRGAIGSVRLGHQQGASARLAVDIGGTFTDVVVEAGGRQTTAKVLTTPAAPERAVMEGIDRVLRRAPGSRRARSALVIHGTTLATNAVIERTGAVHRADHHRRVSRRPGDRRREPLRPVRHQPGQDRSPWSRVTAG